MIKALMVQFRNFCCFKWFNH